jgi:hypothetical protein
VAYDDMDDYCPIHRTLLVFMEDVEAGETPKDDAVRSKPSSPSGGGLLGRLKTMMTMGSNAQSPSEKILPEAVFAKGWELEGSRAVQSTDSADFFSVQRNGGRERALFKRYRSGSDTSPSVYEILGDWNPEKCAKLLFSGNARVAGAECDSELIHTGRSIPFSDYLTDNPDMGASGARWFLSESLEIVQELWHLGLTSSSLHPDSFMVGPEGDLLLCDYGQMFATEPENRFIPGVKNLKMEYAAPEIVNQRRIHTRKSVMYSLGAMAAFLTWGYVPTHSAVLSGDLDFASLPQGILAPLMGLLYPDPENRWNADDLDLWLQGKPPATPDWSRLKPGASSKAFVIHGQAVHLPENLSGFLYDTPNAAADRLDEMLDWLDENPMARDIAREIRRNQADGRNPDWLVLRLAFLLNREHPRSFHGISLDDDVAAVNLAELGRRASNGDAEALDLVERIHNAELHDVFDGGER